MYLAENDSIAAVFQGHPPNACATFGQGQQQHDHYHHHQFQMELIRSQKGVTIKKGSQNSINFCHR